MSYTFTYFNNWTADLAANVHDFVNHTFKIGFTDTQPSLSWERYAQVPEAGSAGNYPPGGYTLGVSYPGSVLTFTDRSITATSDGVRGRFLAVYNVATNGQIGQSGDPYANDIPYALDEDTASNCSLEHHSGTTDPSQWPDFRTTGLLPGSYGSTAAYVAAVKAEANPMIPTCLRADDAEDMGYAYALVPRASATKVAKQNGSWFSTSTWQEAAIPIAGDKVLIPQAITVDYDSTSTASLDWVRVDGHLHFSRTVNTSIKFDTLVVTQTGYLQIGYGTDQMADGVTCTMTIADNGNINTTYDPKLLSRGVLTMGAVEIVGRWKEPFLKCTANIASGSSTFTVQDRTNIYANRVANSWKVGDKVVVTGTNCTRTNGGTNDGFQDEVRTITAINGNTYTVDSPFTFNHNGPANHPQLKPYVANFTRSVIITAEGGNSLPVHRRPHTMWMHVDRINVQGVLFEFLGRTDKSVDATVSNVAGNNTATSNVPGRYSVHIHRTGTEPGVAPAALINCAMWTSPGWTLAHHGSRAIVEFNCSYQAFGAHFVAETGEETGAWRNNIVIQSDGKEKYSNNANTDTKDAQFGPFNIAKQGDGFWFTGRMVEVHNNVAVGVRHGYIFMPRNSPEDIFYGDGAVLATSLEHPDAVRGAARVGANINSIRNFLNNEAYGCDTGLHVIKSFPAQGHGLRSVIEKLTTWECWQGIFLEYTGHYILLDGYHVGQTRGDGGNTVSYRNTGIALPGTQNTDIVIRNPIIDYHYTGIDLSKNYSSDVLPFVSNIDKRRIVVNPTFSRIGGSNYINYDPAIDLLLNTSDINFNMTPYLVITPQPEPYGTSGVNWYDNNLKFNGTKYDRLGSKVYSESFYDVYGQGMFFRVDRVAQILDREGFYREVGTNTPLMLWREYFSDRATGEVFMQGVVFPIADRVASGTFANPAKYKGIYNPANPGPVTSTKNITIAARQISNIDVKQGDTHPQGGTLTIVGITQPTFGKARINTATQTVDYLPDPEFTGSDQIKYWVTNGNGMFTEGKVNITVVASTSSVQSEARLIGFYDLGSTLVLRNGDVLNLDFAAGGTTLTTSLTRALPSLPTIAFPTNFRVKRKPGVTRINLRKYVEPFAITSVTGATAEDTNAIVSFNAQTGELSFTSALPGKSTLDFVVAYSNGTQSANASLTFQLQNTGKRFF